jgi:hypothetical protein
MSEKIGAGEGIRTLDPNLGKVVLIISGVFRGISGISKCLKKQGLRFSAIAWLGLRMDAAVDPRWTPNDRGKSD